VNRLRPDRCPGALRPWPADDGLLVRLRLPGGQVRSASLRALVDLAEEYGDGHVYLTGRANLQVRGLPGAADRPDRLPEHVLGAVEATGLLPSRAHDLVRNLMASPQTGRFGGRCDLRPVVAELDRELCADPDLGRLPGRFLFVLDDGRGDLVERPCDLGLVVLDGDRAQLRVGDQWGPVVLLADAPRRLADLARRFLRVRGDSDRVPWHVRELPEPLVPAYPRDQGVPPAPPALAFGPVPGGTHVPVPATGLGRGAVERLTAAAPALVVTPWHGVLVPEEAR
jgi:precorrin-3B synthase